MKYLLHFWNSKTHAWRGIVYTFKHESNFRLQVFIAILVGGLAWYVRLTELEVIIIVFLIVGVLVLELFNTTIESLADVVKPRLHDQVKIVKDVAAGMVLLTSIAAVIVGTIIFYPYFF